MKKNNSLIETVIYITFCEFDVTRMQQTYRTFAA